MSVVSSVDDADGVAWPGDRLHPQLYAFDAETIISAKTSNAAPEYTVNEAFVQR
jgi:hypothetical protein